MTDPFDRPESEPGPPVPAGLTVLAGPPAAGRSAVVQAIRRGYPQIWLSVPVTTRQPQPGEAAGADHAFVGPAEFDRLVAAGDLLEWARYAGHRYGTPRSPVADRLRSGVPVLLDLDVAGARQVRTAVPDALLVFLGSPSAKEPAACPGSRGSDADFDITLVNTSVEDASAQLVALMTGQPASQPAR